MMTMPKNLQLSTSTINFNKEEEKITDVFPHSNQVGLVSLESSAGIQDTDGFNLKSPLCVSKPANRQTLSQI